MQTALFLMGFLAEPFFVLRPTNTVGKGSRDRLHSPCTSVKILIIKQIYTHIIVGLIRIGIYITNTLAVFSRT